MTSTNKNLRDRIAKMEEDGLDENGRFFLSAAKTLHGDDLADIDVTNNHDDTDDATTPIVRLISTISASDRMRKFGVDGLQRSDWIGKYGIGGALIPTEEYIANMCIGYGDAPEKRAYELRVQRGESLVSAINRAGREIRNMIDRGAFSIAR
jgi:hypothetical protein